MVLVEQAKKSLASNEPPSSRLGTATDRGTFFAQCLINAFTAQV
jgi:hypothetical protein